MKPRLIAVGMGASVLVGLVLGHAQAQLTLRPAPALTVNGQSNSVFSLSLNGGSGPATGAVAYPQSFPAKASSNVPPVIQLSKPAAPQTGLLTLSGVSELQLAAPMMAAPVMVSGSLIAGPGESFTDPTSGTSAPTVSNYSCATYRPDFRYSPAKLAFERQTTTTLGQVDMNFWSGLPPGTNRYVPLGEF